MLLHATAAHVRNASGSNFPVANDTPGTDNDNLANPLPGRSWTGVNIGISHSFRRATRSAIDACHALSEHNGVTRRTP